jgi:hypothetical protein
MVAFSCVRKEDILRNKFDEFDAPQVVAVRIKGNKEKHLWRALKQLGRYFDAKLTFTNIQAVAQFHGYELGYFQGYYFAVQIDSAMDEMLAMDPDVWGVMIEAETDEQVVRVVA